MCEGELQTDKPPLVCERYSSLIHIIHLYRYIQYIHVYTRLSYSPPAILLMIMMRGGKVCLYLAPLCHDHAIFPSLLKHDMNLFCRIRPYQVQCTGSHPNSEVNVPWALLVLGWGTTREHSGVVSVPFFFLPYFNMRGSKYATASTSNISTLYYIWGGVSPDPCPPVP